MKNIITLLLIVTIQITFMQKVMASVPLLKSNTSLMNYCKMEVIDLSHCTGKVIDMQDCQNVCDIMSVVSVTHFIDHQSILFFNFKSLNYLSLITPLPISQPTDLYRPPMFN